METNKPNQATQVLQAVQELNNLTRISKISQDLDTIFFAALESESLDSCDIRTSLLVSYQEMKQLFLRLEKGLA